jgi:fibronectin-binding autotransporter adhesin
VTGGTLRAAGLNLFSPGAALSTNPGTTIDFGGFNQTLDSISGSGTLLLGAATLTLGSGGGSSNIGGSIIGTGGIVKNGIGTLTLSGANALTGGIGVNGGMLVGNTASLPGNIVNNALVVFDQSADGTYAGNMSGSGVFVKNGNASLTLAGVNTYGGGTQVNGGTLIGNSSNLQGTIVDGAALTFDQTANGTFAGLLTGGGAFTKTGPGTLTMNGAQPFTGQTTISQGTLALNGSLGGGVSIGSLGTLIGAGTINGGLTVAGSLSIPASATPTSSLNSLRAPAVAPAGVGGSAGPAAAIAPAATTAAAAPSLFINGDLNAMPGSTLTFTVTPGGLAPIAVNGRAVLTNNHIAVTIQDPNPTRFNTYIGIQAAQGLTATGFDSRIINAVEPVIRADPNALMVTVLDYNVPLAGAVTGTNAGSVGRAIDKIKIGATGDLAAVTRELTALPDRQLSDALTSLSGEVHASKLRLQAYDSQSMTDLIRSTISDREDGAPGANGASTSNANGGSPSKLSAFWMQFAGDHASFATGTADSGGGAAGYDFKNTDRVLLGGGISYTEGSLNLLGSGGSSTMTAPRAFGYTGFGFGPFRIHGGGSAASTPTHTTRPIDFAAMVPNELGQLVPLSDGVNRTATSDQPAVSTDGWTEIKDALKVKTWTFDWKAGIRQAHIARRAFSETGAGAISLSADDQSITTREADLNISVFRRTGKWRPRFQTMYRREFAPNTTTAQVAFAGQPTGSFDVQGLPIPQVEYLGLAGLTMHGNFGVDYTLEYSFKHNPEETHNALSLRMRFR